MGQLKTILNKNQDGFFISVKVSHLHFSFGGQGIPV